MNPCRTFIVFSCTFITLNFTRFRIGEIVLIPTSWGLSNYSNTWCPWNFIPCFHSIVAAMCLSNICEHCRWHLLRPVALGIQLLLLFQCSDLTFELLSINRIVQTWIPSSRLRMTLNLDLSHPRSRKTTYQRWVVFSILVKASLETYCGSQRQFLPESRLMHSCQPWILSIIS